MAEKEWKTDIDDCSKITLPKAEFLLEECKQALQGYLDAADKLDNKAFIIIGVVFAVISGLCGFLFHSKADLAQQITNANPAIIVLIVGYLISIFFLRGAIQPSKFKPMGNAPKNLATKDFFSTELDVMLFREAGSYQVRIDQNINVTTEKSKMIDKAILVAFLSPIAALVVFYRQEILNVLKTACHS